MAKLTTKQKAFVHHYLACWNASEAVRRMDYKGTNADVIGSEYLVKPGIQAAIQSRLSELKMSADEVLTRLTEHARGSIASFLVTNDTGAPTGFNLAPDRPLHLVKKVSITDKGISFEIHDSQTALALLGKAHGLFTDRVEHSGPNGGPIRTEAYDYSAAIAIVTGGSGEDSNAPGEDASAGDGPQVGKIHDGRRD
jgi:phage terminase small subunit